MYQKSSSFSFAFFLKKTLLCHAARRRQHLLLFILTKAEMKGKKRSVNGVTNEFSDGGEKSRQDAVSQAQEGAKEEKKASSKYQGKREAPTKTKGGYMRLSASGYQNGAAACSKATAGIRCCCFFVFLCERRRCIVVPKKESDISDLAFSGTANVALYKVPLYAQFSFLKRRDPSILGGHIYLSDQSVLLLPLRPRSCQSRGARSLQTTTKFQITHLPHPERRRADRCGDIARRDTHRGERDTPNCYGERNGEKRQLFCTVLRRVRNLHGFGRLRRRREARACVPVRFFLQQPPTTFSLFDARKQEGPSPKTLSPFSP